MPIKAPKDIFLNTIRYFPTVSINTVIFNDANEVLFVRRKRQPAKGEWWIPGGRVLLGETLADAAMRMTREEVGLNAQLLAVSGRHFEEFFDASRYSAEDLAPYAPDIRQFHYLGTVAVLRVVSQEPVVLDDQSVEYRWSTENICSHPYVNNYFTAATEAGYPLFGSNA